MRIRALLHSTARFLLWSGLVLALLVTGGITGGLVVRDLLQKYHDGITRIVTPNGIADAGYVTLGGVRQWISVRGMDRSQPILLYLHGGPGGAISDASYAFQKPWEDYFTVVQWDQRGFGRSSIDLDRMQPLSKDQLVADAIELIELLRQRYGQQKVILVGHSFGTLLGASVARQRPDLLHAYVGFAQVTGWRRIFLESRDIQLADAARRGDGALLRLMQQVGPPPDDVKAFSEWTAQIQGPANARGHFWHNADGSLSIAGRFLTWQLFSPTMTLGGFASALTGNRPDRTYEPLVASIMDWDFRKDLGLEFQVPMIFVSGAHDLATPTESVRRLEDEIHAPYKAMVILQHSAHVLVAEEPGRVLEALVQQALPFANGKPR